MPLIHLLLFGPDGLVLAAFYYLILGAPILLVLVPLVGYPLTSLLKRHELQGNKALFAGTTIGGLVGGIAVCFAHGVILEVVAIAICFGGIGGFVWTALALPDLLEQPDNEMV
jgi:hypothetical protein